MIIKNKNTLIIVLLLVFNLFLIFTRTRSVSLKNNGPSHDNYSSLIRINNVKCDPIKNENVDFLENKKEKFILYISLLDCITCIVRLSDIYRAIKNQSRKEIFLLVKDYNSPDDWMKYYIKFDRHPNTFLVKNMHSTRRLETPSILALDRNNNVLFMKTITPSNNEQDSLFWVQLDYFMR